jgi:hypothetical protein
MPELRLLITQAARAAGYTIESFINDTACWVVVPGSYPDRDGERPIFKWDPHNDDGDAFRLAVKLELSINRNTENRFVYASDEHHWHPHEVERIYDDADPYAATRRAIVCAAAAIGEQMA